MLKDVVLYLGGFPTVRADPEPLVVPVHLHPNLVVKIYTEGGQQ